LLFTDITMPGMSGFELIKETRRRHPRVRSVVLTCHHEFDFVQEALRLGAIDYIVKTLLEPETADQTMRRIVERIEWEDGCRAALLADETQRKLPADSALVFRPLDPAAEGSDELFELSFVRRNPAIPIGGMWLTPLLHPSPIEEIRREIKSRLDGRWASALVTGMAGVTVEEAEKTLAERLPLAWFYAPPLNEPLRVDYGEWARGSCSPADRSDRADHMDRMQETFLGAMDLKWTLDAAGWEAFKRAIGDMRPGPERLREFGEALCRDWRGTLLPAEEAGRLQAAIERNRTWADWQAWLLQYSDLVKRRMVELSFTGEVMLCLIRAFRYMKNHAGHKINQADVAAHVNMSRGYFSQCFARLAGEPFGSVLRDLRIDRAKRLLKDTSDPVHRVALASGFEDEKYFSRLFRERVGMLPSEYRALTEGTGGAP
jgi:two-component system response regulator YesN